MIDLDYDEVLLAAVRGPGADREPDAAARDRAAALDTDAQPDLRSDRDRGAGPVSTNGGAAVEDQAAGRAIPHPGRPG